MTKRITTLVLALVLLLSLPGCGVRAQELTADFEPQVMDTTTDLTAGGEAVTDFALSLLREERSGSVSVLLSPVSILNALGMVANGASGTTLKQIETATGMSLHQLNDFLYTYRMSLPADSKTCKAALANSAWLRDTFRVEDAFLRSCVNYYSAEVYRSAFDGGLVTDLNRWVSKKTDGMIGDLLEKEPGAQTMLYLVNAACFDAKWETPYTKENVRTDGIFTAASGKRQTADYLDSHETIYLSGNNVSGFLKPYDGGKYAFVALVPDEGVTLADYLRNLTGEHLYQMITDHHYADVQASIPKFTARSELELEEPRRHQRPVRCLRRRSARAGQRAQRQHPLRQLRAPQDVSGAGRKRHQGGCRHLSGRDRRCRPALGGRQDRHAGSTLPLHGRGHPRLRAPVHGHRHLYGISGISRKKNARRAFFFLLIRFRSRSRGGRSPRRPG